MMPRRDSLMRIRDSTAVTSASPDVWKVIGIRCLLVGLLGGIFALSKPFLVLAAHTLQCQKCLKTSVRTLRNAIENLDQ